MAGKPTHDLILSDLEAGLPGVHAKLGAVHAQACILCLEEQTHTTGVALTVDGDFDASFHIKWDGGTTEDVVRSWDSDEATEWGACGLAFLLILKLTPYTVIKRSWTGTGFDYWLADKDRTDALPFQGSARLEVSGIRKAERDSMIKSRVKQKLEQTKPSDGSLPAYIVVVEFSRPLSRVVKK